MSKGYLIKRNPNFSNSGVLVKRNSNYRGYSETMITASSKNPPSIKCKIGDTIYVAETQYGIYAKGEVVQVKEIKKFDSIDEILKYLDQHSNNEAVYWLDKLKRFRRAKSKNPDTSLKFHSYFINQTLLDRTIPLIEKLERFSKPGFAFSFTSLTNEEVEYIKNPKYNETKTLEIAIPSNLRFDLYSLFNKKYAVQHWIDIDHFVPKSTSGPGNIIENLVPVGLSLNRYKSNSVPKGLFVMAKKYPELSEFVHKGFLKNDDQYLRKTKYRDVIDSARKINDFIRSNWNIAKAKQFYKSVLNEHLHEYVSIIESLKMA